MLLTVQSRQQFALIDEGTYEAKLESIKQMTTVHGSAYRLTFTITEDGPYNNRRVNGVCGLQFHPESKLYKWLSAINYREFAPEEEVDLDRLIGMLCKITVARAMRDGRTYANVVDVMSNDVPF